MGYVTIAQALETKLNTITDFDVVYLTEKKELLKYPAATIKALGHDDQHYTTRDNLRTYTFVIRLYMKNDDTEEAELTLRDLVDQVIAALEADVTLGGTVTLAHPTSSEWDDARRETDVLVAALTVKASQIIPR